MAVIYNKQKFPLYEVCQLLEGDATIVEGWTARGTETVATLSAPLTKDAIVTPAGISDDGMIKVSPADISGSSDIVVGEIASKPVGIPPKEDAVEGEYTPRRADVKFRARKLVTKLVTAEGGSPVTPGSFLAPSDGDEDYVLSADPTTVVSLGDVDTATASIPVLEGYIL